MQNDENVKKVCISVTEDTSFNKESCRVNQDEERVVNYSSDEVSNENVKKVCISVTEDTTIKEESRGDSQDEERDASCSSDESRGDSQDEERVVNYSSDEVSNENVKKVCISVTEDTSIEIESRGDSQDEERDVSCSSDEMMPEDKSVDVLNNQEDEDVSKDWSSRLYDQAIERLKRHEAKIQENRKSCNLVLPTQTELGKKLLPERCQISRVENRHDHLYAHAAKKIKEGKMIRATIEEAHATAKYILENWLVIQKARARAKEIPENKTLSFSKTLHLHDRSMKRLRKNGQVEIVLLPTQSDVPIIATRHDHLYACAAKKIKEGRMRRTAIEEARARAKYIPETKILPHSKARDMYDRSMHRLKQRKYFLSKLAEIQSIAA